MKGRAGVSARPEGAIGNDHAAVVGDLHGFVSYARENSRLAHDMVAAARARATLLWIDSDGIPPGAPWRKELGTAIEAALAFVCVLTPDWLQSQECQLEYQRAVTLGKRIIPVLAVEASPPDELAALNWIDARFVSTERVVELLLVAIETDPEAVRAHTYWLSRAVRWENEGEERSLLLRGAELRNAEEWLAHAGADPSPIPLQRRYIEAGRADEGRRARRRTIAITAAVVICLGLAAIAVIQLEATGTSRRQSESRALASAALNQLNIDPQRALLLAQAAWKTSQTTQALNALEVAVAASRVRLTYRGLAGAAHSMGWGPGDRVVVASGGDGEVRAWNAADARPLGAIAAGQGDVTEFAEDRAGDVGVAGTTGGGAVIWRISPQSQAISTVARLAADDASAVTISADGHSVVLGRRDGGVSLWHLPGLARQTLRPPGSARSECVAVSPDGRTVLSGNSDGTATLWPSGGRPRTIASYRTPVVTCALDSVGDVALTSSEAGPGTVLDTSGGRGVLLRVNHVYGAALSPDGRSVGTDDIDGGVELYDVLSGSHVTLRRNGSAETWLGFNGDGSELAAGGADGITHVWRTSGRASRVADLRGATGLVQGAAFSHDGTLLVTGDGTSGVIKWALPAPPLALAVQRTGSQSATTSSVALSATGAVALTASGLVWSASTATGQTACPAGVSCTAPVLETERLAVQAFASGGPAADAVISPDGAQVAVASGSGHVSLWRLVGAAQLPGPPASRQRVDQVAFSPDGQLLAVSDRGGGARIVDVSDGRVRAVLRRDGKAVYAVAFWGARGVVTAGASGKLWLWDRSGRFVRTLADLHDAVLAIAADPRGGAIAVASGNAITVVGVPDGRVLAVINTNAGDVSSLAYAGRSGLIVAGSVDREVSVWDPRTGEQAQAFTMPSAVNGVATDATGTIIAAATQRTGAYVMPCDVCLTPAQLVAVAADDSVRALSRRERLTFGVPSGVLVGTPRAGTPVPMSTSAPPTAPAQTATTPVQTASGAQARFIASADTVCSRANEALDPLQSRLTRDSDTVDAGVGADTQANRDRVAADWDAVANVYARKLVGLRAIPLPPAGQAAAQGYANAFGAEIPVIVQLASAWREPTGPVTSAQHLQSVEAITLIEQRIEAAQSATAAAARSYGYHICGHR